MFVLHIIIYIYIYYIIYHDYYFFSIVTTIIIVWSYMIKQTSFCLMTGAFENQLVWEGELDGARLQQSGAVQST